MKDREEREFFELALIALRLRWPPVAELSQSERFEYGLVAYACQIAIEGDERIPAYELVEAEFAKFRKRQAVRKRALKRVKAFIEEHQGTSRLLPADDASKRPSDIQPRCLSFSEAARYLGVTTVGFSYQVHRGVYPGPIPGTRTWDRRALDAVIDRSLHAWLTQIAAERST